MALILVIETTTKNCSIALFKKNNLISLKEEVSERYSHSDNINYFIECVLKSANISIKSLDAIALSKGPGSYTGLRIGTSSAKGLCYALDIPLISFSTLQAMALELSKEVVSDFYCPMIDARRMEVYSAIFDANNNMVREIKADIVEQEIYNQYLKNKVVFFGDGALKCQERINHLNANFIANVYPSSKNAGDIIYNLWLNKKFEDVAYFEPLYLKNFILK